MLLQEKEKKNEGCVLAGVVHMRKEKNEAKETKRGLIMLMQCTCDTVGPRGGGWGCKPSVLTWEVKSRETELSNVLPMRGVACHTSPAHFETRRNHGEQPSHAITCLIKTWHKHTSSLFSSSLVSLCSSVLSHSFTCVTWPGWKGSVCCA